MVRWISMRQKRDITHAAHQSIVESLIARNGVETVKILRNHIEKSTEEGDAKPCAQPFLNSMYPVPNNRPNRSARRKRQQESARRSEGG